MLGERSAELTENFARSRKVSIEFEESQAPWMRALYLLCGLGSVLIIPLSLWFYGRGQLSITFLLGDLLFVFDLFGPIKALYSQATRLTVMNACICLLYTSTKAVRLPAGMVREMLWRISLSWAYPKET